MGLDMYLTRESRAGCGKHELLARWHKATPIHKWFENHFEEDIANCELYPVHRKDLERLVEDCKCVKADIAQAPILLPDPDDFLPDPVDYNTDQYLIHIEQTITMLEQVLAITTDDETLYYHAWRQSTPLPKNSRKAPSFRWGI